MARVSDKQKELDSKYYLEKLGYELIPKGYLKCLGNGNILSIKQNNFYQNSNPQYKYSTARTDNGEVQYLPYSKKWIEENYKNLCISTKNDKKLAMYMLTVKLQIPWINSHWEASEQNKMSTLKFYIGKFNSLPQLSSLTMEDTEPYDGNINNTFEADASIYNDIKMKKKDKKEALIRWGDSWNETELARLEEFYHSMKAVNKIDTPQDEDYLRKLARLSVKIDSAIENDASGSAKQLGDLYSKYMSDSQFRAMYMTDADKQGGIRTFSQIFEEVERPDFIPPWEKYAKKMNIKQDIIDKAIMHIENFSLRFNGIERMTTPPSDTPKVEEGEENGIME